MALRAGRAIRAEHLVPEAWKTLDLLAGWEARPGYPVPSFRRVRGDEQVQMIGGMIDGTTDNGTVVARLPEGYRPANDIALPVVANSGESIGLFARINGDLEIFRSSDAKSFSALYITAAFPLDK